MLIDITLKITPKIIKTVPGYTQTALAGHIGTHFDVMNKEFPLEFTRREGIVFDVSSIRGQDIEADDVDLSAVQKDMFVAFHTGYLDEVGYGTPEYYADHPQLSDKLIDLLLDKGVSIIGIDCSGIRRGKEHTPKDQHCADHGAFVVENLAALRTVIENGGRFTAHTYPMSYEGITGLPCRVVAEV